MRTNITAFMPTIGFCGHLPALNLGSGIPSRERLGHENGARVDAEAGGLDAYKVAVLLLVGAAIFSLF
jgi:hypothetical protein